MMTSREGPGTLQLTKSRTSAGMIVGFMVLFDIGWYAFLIHAQRNAPETLSLFWLMFWVAPLMSLPELWRQIRVLMAGETFTLSRASGTIERNGAQCARFADVERIQIRTLRGGDSDDAYRLSIVLKDESKIRIHQSADANEIADVAEDLADMLGAPITRK